MKSLLYWSPFAGILLSGNDISQVLLAIFLSYYGTFGHRPRWLGVGVMFTAASCFSAALPHLMYGPGQDAIDLADATTFDANAFANSSLLAQPKSEEWAASRFALHPCLSIMCDTVIHVGMTSPDDIVISKLVIQNKGIFPLEDFYTFFYTTGSPSCLTLGHSFS